MSEVPSALHVNDAAFTAARLVRRGRQRGYEWDLLPRAVGDPRWAGATGRVRRALRGAAWASRLAVQARRHAVVHVHSATTLPHTRAMAPRYVLHCHGSDVRTAQYEQGRDDVIRSGLRAAEAVFYSTPDLAQHVLPHRPDAILLPVPVDVADLPRWQPAPGRPQVVFASRWEPVKGLEAQLETAGLLAAALGDSADLVGLDWGPGAAAAAASGVRLLPRMDHDTFVRLLAGAAVVIGQAAGILSSSELEALGTGAPLVVPAPLLPTGEAPTPVLGDDPASAAEATRALVRGDAAHDPDAARAWVEQVHGAQRAVDAVAEVYQRVVAAR
jgi:glycosyltransferase involved in cell wall biosynthesis